MHAYRHYIRWSIALAATLLVGVVLSRLQLIHFLQWQYLLLLPPITAYLIYLDSRTMTDMSPGRRRFSLLFRMVLCTLLIFTLAGFKLMRKGESLAVVFLVDGSRSIRDDQRLAIRKYLDEASRSMHTVDRVGLITFAQDPHTQSSPGQSLDSSRIHDPGVTASTDIAQGLRTARSELDSTAKDSGKRIVLISDGNETTGRALAEAPELAADHILLDTVTLPISVKKEALVDKVVTPSRVKIGEPFQVRVVVESLTAQTAKVGLMRDARDAGSARTVQLHAGKNVVVFDENVDKPGNVRYTATVDAPEDTIPENNKGEALVQVQGRPAILYVADSPALTGFLRQALQTENINVDYASPEAMPTSAADLQRYDSVFLSNVRAADLSTNQMLALQVACRDFGVGFGMVGGENSFGAGGWRGTPVEEVLPVSMDVKIDKRLPSVAVAMVIEDLEIPSSINMSIEAAKGTMDLLEPIDQVGVLDCNGMGSFGFGGGQDSPSGTWRIPMQHVTDREALKVAMQNLQGMGDPPSYQPYLLEAARVLNNTDAKVKHIIFLGDGDAVYEQNQGAIAASLQKIRNMGITISTIATGATGADDVKFMATMAFVGGGQAYVAERPQDLPRLLLKDQMTISQPPIIEEPFMASPVEGEEIFRGIDWNSAPPLLGYNVSNLKATAELSLISHRKDPIFASWRYGLGRSVAFMSDDRARWGARWLGWPGYAKFWAQAIRYTLRPFAPSEYSTNVAMDGGKGHITVDALDAHGSYVNRLHFSARVAAPYSGGIKSPPAEELPVRQTAPGHYEGWFDAPKTGTYLVNVVQKAEPGEQERSSVVGLSTAYSPEYRALQSNKYLMNQLAAIGSGRADPAAPRIFGADRPIVYSTVDLTYRLLALAAILLPIDVAIRRLAIDWSDVKKWLRLRRSPSKTTTSGATPELGRLLDRKSATVLSHDYASTVEERGTEAPVPVAASASALHFTDTSANHATEVTRSVARSQQMPDANESESSELQQPGEEAPTNGMSRLMAAKLRAQKRQQTDDERGSNIE